MIYLWIAIGSALGGMARYACTMLANASLGTDFPWGTLLVNISGCFVIGFFACLTGEGGRLSVSHATRQFVMVGLCGGYTTFSAFSLQTLNLLQDGDPASAALNAGLSVGLCMLAVWLGYALAIALNPVKGA